MLPLGGEPICGEAASVYIQGDGILNPVQGGIGRMAERCPWTSERALDAFLAEPEAAEWKEFRQHYLYCEACAAAVVRWSQLEGALRAMGENSTAHPAVEQLAQFQRSPEQLPADLRKSIQEHLASCRACAEELSLVQSFDFSLLDTDKEPAPAEVRQSVPQKERPQKPPGWRGASFQEAAERFFDGLRQLLWHPAFAYAVALLLCIPAIRYYSLPVPAEPTRSPTGPTTRMPVDPSRTLSGLPPAPTLPTGEPVAAALALLQQYRSAYEARDLKSLHHIWEMNPETRQSLEQLFHDARAVSLLIDIKEVRVREGGKAVTVEFAQVATLLKGTESFSARGPFFYSADIRRREGSGEWVIEELQELPG